jgi:hypothetical protein
MRTLRAFFWGSVVGAFLGYMFAPRGSDVLRAQQAETANARQQQGAATPASQASQASQAPSSGAARQERGAYIGNSHTKVYHASTDPNLPEEENRVYFDTSADAEMLGYRPAAQLTNAS